MFGAGGGTSSYKEVEETDLLILWGSNARETHPIFFHHVLKAVHNGARLYVVDPRRTGSAQWADTWLGLDVGTDIALSNTIAREIIHAGLTNERFIERATTGFEEYRASVEPWTLEEGERVTGVPAEVIRELAHAYARADRAILCWTLGITEHLTAVDNVLSLINLALLTGHVGRYGSGLNPLRGQNNVQGGGDMGAIPNKLPGFQDVQDDMEARARFEAAWDTQAPARARLAPVADVRRHGARRAQRRSTSSARTRRSPRPTPSARYGLLEGLDFMIAQDILMTKTCEMADVVLPVVGVVVRVRRRHGDQLRAPRAADAQGDRPARRGARRPVDHLRARAAGSATTGASRRPRRSWDELRSLSPMHGGMSYERLEELGGIQWPCPTEDHPGSPFLHGRLWAEPVERPARAVLGHAVGAAGRRARRRLPDPADHRPAAGLLQHRRAVGPLPLAAAPRRDARPVAQGRRAPRRRARRDRADHLAPRLDRGAGAARSRPAPGPRVHDHALPRRGRRQHPHHRRDRPEVGHRRVQGHGDPGGEGPRASDCRRDQHRGRRK